MEIKLLPTEINERFRSNININNLTQCILELIFNSLDAKANTIAVRINIAKHEVQIVDNGVGISLDDLENVGIRYMTSRFVSSHSFENKHNYYGYKGESIASIICISKTFNITTRYYRDTNTYCKTFENGSFVNIVPVNGRCSKGTTASVNGFLFNYPVKQRRIKSSLELNNIKVILKSLAVIHPKVSFSLRDNTTGRILLDCYRTETVSKSLCALYKGIIPECLLTVKVSKDNITVSGLIYTKTYQNCKPQLVYVNRRPVNNEIIEKHVKENLLKAFDDATTGWNSVFVININCPYTEVNFSFDSSNILVEFKSWNIVLQCISKMISLFTKKYKKVSSQKQELEFEELQNTENTIVNMSSEQKVDNKTQLKNESSNILRMENEKIKRLAALNALNNLKKYRKSLGLKKSKLKLKKKKCNIFEKTNEFSQVSLTLKEIPSSKPLKGEKLKRNPVCLKTIFDDQFDSQNFVYDDKLNSPTQFASQRLHTENDEAQGKEFVMDLFLKSLTPSLSENNMLHIKTEKLEDKREKRPDDKVMVPKAPGIGEISIGKTSKSSSISLSSATKNNQNPPESIHISFDNKLIKKRRIDKLNKIGTSLMNNKLFKIKNVNSMAVQTSFSTDISGEELRNIPAFVKNQTSTFRRVKSEDKSVQTNLVDHKYNRVSVGVQSSPDNQADHKDRGLSQKKISQKGQIHTEFDQNSMCSSSAEAYNTPKPSQNIDKNYNKSNSNVQNGNTISKEATFSSHWYPKYMIDESSKMQNTTIEFNTRNILKDFNSVQDLEKNKPNLFLQNNFTLNFSNANDEDDANISRFFNGGKTIKRTPFKLNFDEEMRKNNFSMSINTSRLFQEHARHENIPMEKSNNLNITDSYQTAKDGFQSETMLTFNNFMPAHKSTQKGLKYRGRSDNNFFESFIFHDCRKSIQEENNGLFDITFPPDLQPNAFSSETMPREEWSQRFDNVGNNYFVNKRTGMTTYNIHSKESNFLMQKRADFVPKGLSPILKKVDSIDVSLSPTSKKQLNNAIIESYECELDLVKWQDYIDKEDPETFFNKLYEEKRKQLEQVIPCIEDVCLRNAKKVYSPDEAFTFSKDIFKTLEVLGQMDNKFIVALSNLTLIILLDQHAVHERIRVEYLLRDYAIQNADQIIFKSSECKESFTINYTSTELQLLSSFKSQFENFGLFFEVYSSCIKVNKVPLCFAKKCMNNTIPEENLCKLVSNLVNEELMIIHDTRGILANIPKIIQYVINNEACRGAIKFGRTLTRNECIQYVRDLSECQLPFQCAHGRPTLFPILEISGSNKDGADYNLKKIFK